MQINKSVSYNNKGYIASGSINLESLENGADN